MWQGSVGDRRPYADLTRKTEVEPEFSVEVPKFLFVDIQDQLGK